MSNIFPSSELKIPPEEEERPVRHLNGIVFTHEAWHCRPKDLWPKGYTTLKDEWRDPIERYLAAFTRPIRSIADELRCFVCDAQLTGHSILLKDYRFQNNLTYSREGTWEGRCTQCGYPCRLKHDIFMPNNGPRLVGLTGFPLLYHPSATQKTQ